MTEFKLHPDEQAVFGVRVKGSRLILKATLAARIMGMLYLTVGVTLVVVGAAVRTPATIVLALIGTFVAIGGWRAAVACVIADSTGIIVTNHWRVRSVGWDEFEAVRVESLHSSYGRLPYSSPWTSPHTFTCGVIKLRGGGSVVPDALVSFPARQMGDLPVASEVKVAVLSRLTDGIRGGSGGTSSN